MAQRPSRTGHCRNAQVCWRCSMSFRSEHLVRPGATRLVHTCLIFPRHRAGRLVPIRHLCKRQAKLCCGKSLICAPPRAIPDSRGVRGPIGALVWFILKKMLRFCLLLLSPSPHTNHTNRKVRPNNPLINASTKNYSVSHLLISSALPRPRLKLYKIPFLHL